MDPVEAGVCSRVELAFVELVRVVVELAGMDVELESVVEGSEVVDLMEVVELVSVDAGALLPRTIPCSMKYWAEVSVPMMSSPKNPKPTTVPFLYWWV